MADNFDAVDIIYDAIKSIGVPVFLDRSPRDQSGEHVVVSSNTCAYDEVVNIPQVNVNIFVPRTSNGMINRTRVKALRTLVYNAVDAASPDNYCVIDQVFSALIESSRMSSVKEAFDCFTIRYELTLNK